MGGLRAHLQPQPPRSTGNANGPPTTSPREKVSPSSWCRGSAGLGVAEAVGQSHMGAKGHRSQVKGRRELHRTHAQVSWVNTWTHLSLSQALTPPRLRQSPKISEKLQTPGTWGRCPCPAVRASRVYTGNPASAGTASVSVPSFVLTTTKNLHF